MKWFVLALCALVAGTASAPVDETIPFSGGSGQIFASSDDVIKSFRRQKPTSPESPAVIPIDSHLPDRLPTTELEPPLEPSRLSHLHPRSVQQLEQITEQNSTTKSVGSESSSKPNSESIDQSHHVTSEDSQLKSDFATPGIPGQFALLQVQVREIFPEKNSPVTSVPELPRSNRGKTIQHPNHVHEVPKEDAPQPENSELSQPQHGSSDQLPKHVLEVPEEDSPETIKTDAQHGQSDQLPKHVQEMSEQDPPQPIFKPSQLVNQLEDLILSPLPLIPETKPSNFTQSVQQFPNLPRPEHDTPQKSIPEPVRQDSELLPQVSIGQQDTPRSIVPEAPPRPNFNRSLHLFDYLSVPYSHYTEAYDIEWHKESNTARTVIENSTTIYRKVLPDGRIQYLEIKLDRRTTGNQIRRCTMSPPLVPTSSVDTAFPGLPEMGPFQFAGSTIEESRSRLFQVEHWQYIVFGRPGQGGAAREESVNVTHDFFVVRDGGDAVPLRYTVTKDSSLLGPESDTYTHHYIHLPAPTAAILPDTTRECDVLEELKEDTNRRRRTAGTAVG